MTTLEISHVEKKSWTTFNKENFPRVGVKMKGVPENDSDFNNFLISWLDLYSSGEPFSIYFDTTEVGMVSMKYAFKMRTFIKKLKSSNKYRNGLQYSLIKVKNSWTKLLLRIIFTFERPVAPVYVYQDNDELEKKLINSLTEANPPPSGVKVYYP